ncbi:Holliday junction resolvase RuvX [Campylobacter ureolyticus]|uniref:Putative pre-16S rRNA nuclease n=1 Tax=Campylobacter ureolyticus TaxID=827 RepID=A0A9Q4KPP8_9BACT|nr:Holliday junction resolvase RuvX [Campylobacter ureolyticus]MCZ6133928.1 Holliday junction resolvase RuvX [Campylobacter ureolyticus]MCZ6161669.1 Holliday junction resolvase RuvX [Campylobacter ureolyticus]MCZ6170742.1 Holliday junction resolvase RuvX [Campylobacter ureolyticus]
MIACIDVGLKRIGIALGYKNGVIVPINAVLRQNRNQAAKDVKHILDEWNVKKLVVGIPLGGSSEDEMRRRISHFVNLLDFNGEIVFFDESFSSVEAGEFGVANHKKKDGKLDSLSAMVILQRYFDSLR